MTMVNPASVLDVGCGTGTWLKAFEEQGIADYLGVDGNYVDRTMLRIPEKNFVAIDITKPFDLSRKFDLVLSLEVAEHLPPSVADTFVSTLVRHGTAILFSCAIPGQGGQNHLNEQWPAYWSKKFAAYGYYFHDSIRPMIWDNEKVEWWYRQNIFLVTQQKSEALPLSLVHPRLFESNANYVRDHQQKAASGGAFYKTLRTLKSRLKSFIQSK
jgi:SAM-dependent methyltransferase